MVKPKLEEYNLGWIHNCIIEEYLYDKSHFIDMYVSDCYCPETIKTKEEVIKDAEEEYRDEDKLFLKSELRERIELSFEELGDKMVLINHRKYIDREDMFKILKDNFEEILKE